MFKQTKSLNIALPYIGKRVEVIIDRPIGSKHPKYDFVYEVNYGYIPGVLAPDGEDLDVYYMGVDEPLEKASGICIAVAHRNDDDDDKLIVVPVGVELTDQEIMQGIKLNEKWFDTEIIRGAPYKIS